MYDKQVCVADLSPREKHHARHLPTQQSYVGPEEEMGGERSEMCRDLREVKDDKHRYKRYVFRLFIEFSSTHTLSLSITHTDIYK